MLGLAISAGSMAAVFTACKQEAKLSWTPLFLEPHQASLVAEIAETILPKTKTPGAKDMAVPQFIDKMVQDTMDVAAKKSFLEGMDSFEAACQKSQGSSFLELSAAQKHAFLMEQEKDNPRSGMSLWGINLEPTAAKPTFYKIVKSLTLFGYYTAQPIGEKILAYDPVPGPYIACMPLNGQNAWNE